MTNSEDDNLTFWFWYAVVAGLAFGVWRSSFLAWLFATMIGFPALACVGAVHSWVVREHAASPTPTEKE